MPVPAGEQVTADALHLLGLSAPLGEPGVVVTDLVSQTQPDTMDFADFRATPGGAVEGEKQAVRPTVAVREIVERKALGVDQVCHHEPLFAASTRALS